MRLFPATQQGSASKAGLGLVVHVKHALTLAPMCEVCIDDLSLHAMSLKHLIEKPADTPVQYQELVTTDGSVLPDTQSFQEAGMQAGEADLLLVRLAARPGDLLRAVREGGDEATVRYLLNEADDVNVLDEFGRSALHHAVDSKRVDLCKLFLGHERFAQSDAANAALTGQAAEDSMDEDWGHSALIGTALQLAIQVYDESKQKESLEICELLLHAERFTAMNARFRFKWSKCYVPDYEAKDATVLHLAAARGMTDICKMLLQSPRFTEVNARDADGNTALHYCVVKQWQETIKILLESTLVDADIKNNDGCTAFRLGVICSLPIEEKQRYQMTDDGCIYMSCRRESLQTCKVLLACDCCRPPPDEIEEYEDASMRYQSDIDANELPLQPIQGFVDGEWQDSESD